MNLGTTGTAIVAVAAIATVGVVLVLVKPETVSGWAPLLAALVIAVPGVIANFQNRQAAKAIEEVRQDVNSGATNALEVKGAEAYARGQRDTLSELKPLVADAVKTALAAEREAVAAETAQQAHAAAANPPT